VKAVLAFILLLAVAPATRAHADNKPADKLTDAQRRQYARVWFERGRDQFERLKHYDEAIASFSESYRFDPRPLILFDIGNVARVAGLNDVAAEHFRRYLQVAGPLEPEVAEARTWLNKLSSGAKDASANGSAPPDGTATAAPAPAIVPAAALPPATTPVATADGGHGARTKLIAGLTVGGLGLALTATGAGLLGDSASLGDQLTAQAKDGHFDRNLYDRGNREQLAGAVLVGVGAAAAVAGTIVAIVGARERRHAERAPQPTGVTLGASSTGLSVAW
jgi:hypothetical protein